MRPDNPKCETCVAYQPDEEDVGGWCKRKPQEFGVAPNYWCMKHETPEEWAMRTNMETERLMLSVGIKARRTE